MVGRSGHNFTLSTRRGRSTTRHGDSQITLRSPRRVKSVTLCPEQAEQLLRCHIQLANGTEIESEPQSIYQNISG